MVDVNRALRTISLRLQGFPVLAACWIAARMAGKSEVAVVDRSK